MRLFATMIEFYKKQIFLSLGLIFLLSCGVEEKVKAYGWHCDGNDITGHYVTTENYQLTYNMDGVFTKMVPLRELAQKVA